MGQGHSLSLISKRDRRSMDFEEALRIARANPGFLLSRDSAGGFVVKHPDGSLIEGKPEERSSPPPLKPNESSQLGSDPWNPYDRAEEQARKHKRIIRELENRVRDLSEALASEKQKLERCSASLATAKERLSRVSTAEIERITSEDEAERERKAEGIRGIRREVPCSCRGEVENCYRCLGTGVYVIDGHGNIV